MDIRIITASHIPYKMPVDDIYLPVHAGAAVRGSIGMTCDDTGDNISSRNPYYCELTALYWAWKNVDADYIGLDHYRRHFSYRGAAGSKYRRILDRQHAEKYLEHSDILLPYPRHYYIETNYSQYAHAHHAADLDAARDVIAERYPYMIPAYDRTMKRTGGHRFNMLIMKKAVMDEYCTWLFDVLGHVEERLDISGYNENDQRVFGHIAERLLDVWLEYTGYSYTNIPYVFMERSEPFTKAGRFLFRKIKGAREDRRRK